MRLSVIQTDPGYDLEKAHRCRVLVDGLDVTSRCYTAIEELGEAHVFKFNENGNPYYDHELGEVPWEILEGKVEIVLDN